ncbi:Basic-leucine zipper domain [Sesbania bispinosa]|nr:Basic-leucine zipper domain [Sesbania bispinosa]
MEPIFGALPDMLDLGSFHRRTYSDYSLHLNHTFDDLLLQQPEFNFATNDFKFPPPPPLTAAEMVLTSVEPKLSDQPDGIGAFVPGANAGEKDGGRKRVQRRHRHSNSVDVSETSNVGKKILTDEKLNQLYNVDPMKAKRILANRESAARSKAKKMRYAMELELRVERLKVKSATMVEQISIVKMFILQLQISCVVAVLVYGTERLRCVFVSHGTSDNAWDSTGLGITPTTTLATNIARLSFEPPYKDKNILQTYQPPLNF